LLATAVAAIAADKWYLTKFEAHLCIPGGFAGSRE
jgi:hypothetical protein